GTDLQKELKKWKQDLKDGDKDAKRAPAPDYKKTFSNELDKIDGTLLDDLDETAKNDKDQANWDGRDLVKKYGYLIRMTNTHPHIVLKYIASKCDVLTRYPRPPKNKPLISQGLVDAGKSFNGAIKTKEEGKIKKAKKKLLSEIDNCHAEFRV